MTDAANRLLEDDRYTYTYTYDAIEDYDGNAPLKVISVARENSTERVYNFEVQGTHSYFAGDVGAWVHNINLKDIPKSARRALHAFKKSEGIGSRCDVKRDIDNDDRLFEVPNQKNAQGKFDPIDLGVTLDDILNGRF